MNTENTLRRAICIEQFWDSLQCAITRAGGVVSTNIHELRAMTLQQAVETYAQNGIRFIFDSSGVISNITPAELVCNAITAIELKTQELEDAKKMISDMQSTLHKLQDTKTSVAKILIGSQQYPKHLWRKCDGERFTLNEHTGLYSMDSSEMKQGYIWWYYNDLVTSEAFTTREINK